MVSAIALQHLTKRFANPMAPRGHTLAVDGVTLEVGATELLTVVGPSGCGKSTIVRLIAGLEVPSSGTIHINGQPVNDVPMRDRNVGLMFQEYALFSHMTVANNIAFGLKIKRVSARKRRDRIDELVSLIGLRGLEDRRPAQLSGGQRQRVALARALAPSPDLLLLDEPFGAVDAKVRQKLRADTKRWQRQLEIPIVLVTHNRSEAFELGDRVAVMNQGRLEQVDSPRNVYDRPAGGFVARFVGHVDGFSADLGPGLEGLMPGGEAKVVLRPEDGLADLPANGRAEGGPWTSGTIVAHSFLGRTVRLEVRLQDSSHVAVAVERSHITDDRLEPGSAVSLTLDTGKSLPVESHV